MAQEFAKQIPLRRIAETHELSDVIAFLATPAAGYINGQVIHVDGGRTAAEGCRMILMTTPGDVGREADVVDDVDDDASVATAMHGVSAIIAFQWAAGIFAIGVLLATLMFPGQTSTPSVVADPDDTDLPRPAA